MLYWEGYRLAKKYNYINEEQMHVLYACYWMVNNDMSIRETAARWEYTYTTLWRRIHKECKELSPDLYGCVLEQIQRNLEKRGKRK